MGDDQSDLQQNTLNGIQILLGIDLITIYDDFEILSQNTIDRELNDDILVRLSIWKGEAVSLWTSRSAFTQPMVMHNEELMKQIATRQIDHDINSKLPPAPLLQTTIVTLDEQMSDDESVDVDTTTSYKSQQLQTSMCNILSTTRHPPAASRSERNGSQVEGN